MSSSTAKAQKESGGTMDNTNQRLESRATAADIMGVVFAFGNLVH